MQKTTNYKLNQWEATDPIRREDFNADNAVIDAALKNQAESLAALNTTVAGKGNCHIEAGTYTGTGVYGSNNKNTLTFSKQPLAVFIGGGSYNALMIHGNSRGTITDQNGTVQTFVPSWESNGTVAWYSSSDASHQMNINDANYVYFALLN